jgi:aminoglycoside phosphotransferase (APT) family kinase protein
LPFTLPEHVEVSTETLRAIAYRHGVEPFAVERLPETGIFNAVYRLGADGILRIPRNHPDFIRAARREAVAAPAARAAGVLTPRLLAFDESLDLLPVPYTLYERVPGVPLESLGLDPDEAAPIWREHGRNLARAHVEVAVQGEIAELTARTSAPDPREQLAERVAEGWLAPLDARWLGAWLDRLAPAAREPVPARFLHGDTQAANVMISTGPLRYEAVIDWGAAAAGDVALDFAGVPLRAVPHLLAGHREVAPLDDDATAEARILWRHLQLGIWMLPRGAAPGRSWAERPFPMLLEALRFFLEPPDDCWRDLRPLAADGLAASAVTIAEEAGRDAR